MFFRQYEDECLRYCELLVDGCEGMTSKQKNKTCTIYILSQSELKTTMDDFYEEVLAIYGEGTFSRFFLQCNILLLRIVQSKFWRHCHSY